MSRRVVGHPASSDAGAIIPPWRDAANRAAARAILVDQEALMPRAARTPGPGDRSKSKFFGAPEIVPRHPYADATWPP
jgi:hypothetical protein